VTAHAGSRAGNGAGCPARKYYEAL